MVVGHCGSSMSSMSNCQTVKLPVVSSGFILSCRNEMQLKVGKSGLIGIVF